MSYFNVHVINRDTAWILTSVDFVKLLRNFMDDQMLVVQMCACAQRGYKVAWFWQQKDNTLDLYHVLKAGHLKHILHGYGYVSDRNIRSYECHYAKLNAYEPTMVIDYHPRDFEALMVRSGVVALSKRMTGFNTPYNDRKGHSEYELMFCTDWSKAIGDIKSYVTEMRVSPESGLSTELLIGQSQSLVNKNVLFNGIHVGISTELKIPKSSVLELAANKNIIDILRRQCEINILGVK